VHCTLAHRMNSQAPCSGSLQARCRSVAVAIANIATIMTMVAAWDVTCILNISSEHGAVLQALRGQNVTPASSLLNLLILPGALQKASMNCPATTAPAAAGSGNAVHCTRASVVWSILQHVNRCLEMLEQGTAQLNRPRSEKAAGDDAVPYSSRAFSCWWPKKHLRSSSVSYMRRVQGWHSYALPRACMCLPVSLHSLHAITCCIHWLC
jgi:hypothetical protein